jgi:hypothetical protein
MLEIKKFIVTLNMMFVYGADFFFLIDFANDFMDFEGETFGWH